MSERVSQLWALVRSVLGLVPLSRGEALGTIAAGAALAVAFTAFDPDWVPDILRDTVRAVGVLAILRGLIGLTGLLDGLLGALRRWPGNRSPRTEAEIADVLARKPKGWEYLSFAGYLLVGRARVEPLYRDHELRYAVPTHEAVRDEDVARYLGNATSEAMRLVAVFSELVDHAHQERAFGKPGEAGDPERIRHLADRWTSCYEDLLQWAARLHAVVRPPTFVPLFGLVARLFDETITNYRTFVDEFVTQIDRVPAAIRAKQDLNVHLDIVFSVPDELSEQISVESDRLAEADAPPDDDFDQL
jgi:hypothetical protein